jgi:phage N-6-adenine-methyltransferase
MSALDPLFSRKSDEWATPQWLFDQLHAEFDFSLDPCATEQNTKCPTHYTLTDNGLTKTWSGAVFVNPPYSAIAEWSKKALSERNHSTVVLLVPARTDTRWFVALADAAAEVRFLTGRLRFGESITSAPFPSAVIVLRPPFDPVERCVSWVSYRDPSRRGTRG